MNKKGFTLVEMAVVLAVVAILSAILVPAVEGIIKSAKIARAQDETGIIAHAIVSFYKDVGRWPVARPRDGSNFLRLLYSPGQVPTYNTSVPTSRRWRASGTGAWARRYVDEFAHHLIENNPKGRGRWRYPETGDNAWKGPYLTSVKPDPWGNHYSSNVRGLWDPRWSNIAVWVWSAGPDGEADTPIRRPVDRARLRDDDVGTRLK